MGESQQEQLSLGFDARVRLEFVGSRITSDAGLLAYRELDEQLGLTEMADRFLAEQRTRRNVQHRLVPLVRQSVYSRLAGYPDTNDADRLARDPAMRLVVSRRASDKQAAACNTVGRFETEILSTDDNRAGLAALNADTRRPCADTRRPYADTRRPCAEVAVPRNLFGQILRCVRLLSPVPT